MKILPASRSCGASRRVTAAFGALVCVVLSFGARVEAATPTLRDAGDAIEVRPGATCLDRVALVEQVEAWLGGAVIRSDLRIEVRGDPVRPRVVTFQMSRNERVVARRRFAPAPENCAHMHAIIGLAIALALKASLLDELIGPVPAATASSPKLAVGSDVRVGLNVLPGTAIGLSGFVVMPLAQNFLLRGGGVGFAGAERAFAGQPGRFRTTLLAFEADACAVFAVARRVTGRGCLGVLAGAFSAAGSGFAEAKAATVPWFAIENPVALSAEIVPGWALEGMIALLLPLQNTSVDVRAFDGTVVNSRSQSPTAGEFALGLRYEF